MSGWGSVVGGRWWVVGGRWSVVGGRWSVVGGRRSWRKAHTFAGAASAAIPIAAWVGVSVVSVVRAAAQTRKSAQPANGISSGAKGRSSGGRATLLHA